jgi:phage terminase large subunit-like protein
MSIITLIEEWQRLGPVGWAENDYGWIAETGKPITLADWQRLILGEYWQRREAVSTLFISAPKKSGKTLLNSLLTCYRWLTRPGIHFCLGNDWDQAAMLQAAMVGEMVKRHPLLKRYVKETRQELVFTPTGSRLVTLASDYAGSAGHNFLTVSFTELWAFAWESHLRLYEELTPPPLVEALRIVDSYAGWFGESIVLEAIWERAEKGERIGDNLTLTGQQLSYIAQNDEGHRQTWRGTEAQRLAYLKEQEETLRAGTFRRLHANLWQSAEDTFITPEQWDRLISPGYHCPEPDRGLGLHVAVDIGVKRDWAAVASVTKLDNGLGLGPYRIWKPSKGVEVDLEAVEDYLKELDALYNLLSLAGDPSQFLYMKQRLNRGGIKTEEFIQSPSQLSKAGNALFDSIRQTRLMIYPGADDLRECVLNARGKETERGVRLVKQTQSRKIDAAIALAMAVALAMEEKVLKEVSAW